MNNAPISKNDQFRYKTNVLKSNCAEFIYRTKNQRLYGNQNPALQKKQFWMRNTAHPRHINGKATNGGSGFAFLIVNAYNKNIIETGNFCYDFQI